MSEILFKHCTACDKELPATKDFFFFYTDKRDNKKYMRSRCRECTHKIDKERRQHSPEGHKRCTACKKIYSVTDEFFVHYQRSRDGFFYQCKECNKTYRNRQKNATKQVNETIIIQPTIGTPDQCGSCGTGRGNILGDVDDITHKRYGYLCAKCYRLVCNFQGDSIRIRNVLDYIERTRLLHV